MNAPIPELRRHDLQTDQDSFQVSLLEAPLHCEENGTPVLQLLTALCQYHRLRDLSHQERFGKPDSNSRRALSQLEETRKSLQALTARPGGGSAQLHIEASLNLKMSPASA